MALYNNPDFVRNAHLHFKAKRRWDLPILIVAIIIYNIALSYAFLHFDKWLVIIIATVVATALIALVSQRYYLLKKQVDSWRDRYDELTGKY